jgi:hypothetical protein
MEVCIGNVGRLGTDGLHLKVIEPHWAGCVPDGDGAAPAWNARRTRNERGDPYEI